MVIRLIIGGDTDGVELDRAAGMYVAFLASAGALAGAVLNFRESGGDLTDLTDLDKLKSSFNSTDRRQPPPPPPPRVVERWTDPAAPAAAGAVIPSSCPCGSARSGRSARTTSGFSGT